MMAEEEFMVGLLQSLVLPSTARGDGTPSVVHVHT